jgi:hypothetical protein
VVQVLDLHLQDLPVVDLVDLVVEQMVGMDLLVE